MVKEGGAANNGRPSLPSREEEARKLGGGGGLSFGFGEVFRFEVTVVMIPMIALG